MNIERVLWEYNKKFGVRINNQLIIKALFNNGELTADEICKLTKIPKGRVYEYLNELNDKKLILKTNKHPSKYYIDSIEERAIEYFCSSLESTIKRQQPIIEKMKVEDNIIPITNLNEYVILRSREKFCANQLGYIMRDGAYHSFFFPWDKKEDYFKFRLKLGKYSKFQIHSIVDKMNLNFTLNATRHVFEKQVPTKSVMSEDSFNSYLKMVEKIFGTKQLENRLNYVLNTLDDNKKFKLRQIKEPCSYDLTLTEKSLVFVIIEAMPEESFLNGFLIRDKKKVNKHWSILETRFDKGTDMKKIIENKVKEI